MRRKISSIIICMILIISSFILIDLQYGIIEVVEGETLYVNATGEGGAYICIQDAIDVASSGDTVFVYNGIYYENVLINKTINLIGEDRNTTIINANNSGNVMKINANWVNVSGFSITNSGWGSTESGIMIRNSENCSIINNMILNNWFGVFTRYSKTITFNSNNISYNDKYGILLASSSNGILIGNKLIENGILITSSSLNDWTSYNIDTSNMVNGKPVYYWKNKIGGSIPSGGGEVLLANCSDIVIDNQNFMNSTVGIVMGYSFNNNIRSNNISSNLYGIYLENSHGNEILNNTLMSIKQYGICLYHSNENEIKNNSAINSYCGIYIIADKTNIIGNNVSLNTYGVILSYSTDNYVESNYALSNNLVGISLSNSDKNIVNENIILLNPYGISFHMSDRNKITNNTVSNNSYGIHFPYSSNCNNITGNLINSNNLYGIHLQDSSYNYIYHNNIINNGNQSYDNRINNQWNFNYPLGGNYWSDYYGNDIYKGPNQDQPGSDGIGDSPYVINSINQDNYPLIEPYIFKRLENYTILHQGWNMISIPFIQENQNLKKVLEMIDGYYDAVQWYDSSYPGDPWKHYNIGKPFGNDLSKINETIGFWIHITHPGDTIFLYNGTQPSENQTITIHKGWNLVGYPSLSNHNRSLGLNNLEFGVDVDALKWYNSTSKAWHSMELDDNFIPGRGYWLHSNFDSTWQVPL